jgi:hypothetical protein
MAAIISGRMMSQATPLGVMRILAPDLTEILPVVPELNLRALIARHSAIIASRTAFSFAAISESIPAQSGFLIKRYGRNVIIARAIAAAVADA